MKQLGYIHIYCGDGKGKTTCAMGLCARAAGSGLKVLIYQFMKDNRTCERKALEAIPGITFADGLAQEKFSFRMTDEEKEARRQYYRSQFLSVTERACREGYNLLFLDEIIYAIRAGLFQEKLLLDWLCTKPEELEVILTGQGPSQSLMNLADYVSEICKRKHPFDQGVPARRGIEC